MARERDHRLGERRRPSLRRRPHSGWNAVIVGISWSTIPLPDAASSSWAHPGAAVGGDGTIYLGAADGCGVHRLDAMGSITTLAVPTTECHGIAVHPDGGLWIADPGRKDTLHDGALRVSTTAGCVIRVSSRGLLERKLTAPRPGWMPTGVAIDSDDDRVWVADGYGLNEVHAFSANGELLWTSDGESSGTRFSTPHGIVIDRRGSEPRLLIADRGNRRIVALSLDGDYLDAFGTEVLTSPSGLAIDGDVLWVSELFGAIVAMNSDAQLIRTIGDPAEKLSNSWPNTREGDSVAAPLLTPGAFRSPHGIAVLPNGSVIVTEWIIGGRASIISVD
ncbi:hypothetical protein [Salinibacterium sp.]|uniref:hypothetical protein n=1 Tax=Salinibacterium sp. TaxID=1915057 RepID=UPI00286A42D1|nr:hypothetical protein [Salinibacterium sp.]